MRDKLNVRQIQSAKPKDKPYTLHDGGSLRLLILPNGARYWQFRYRRTTADGKRRDNTMNLGSFPSMSLADARTEAEKHRAISKAGQDPQKARAVERVKEQVATALTFAGLAAEWIDHRRSEASAKTVERDEGIIRRVLLPVLGPLPLRDIDAQIFLKALRSAEKGGTVYSAHRARSIASQIFVYAIGSGRASQNPAQQVRGALRRKPGEVHRKALGVAELGDFVRKLESGVGVELVTSTALRLMLYTGLRDAALRGAQWGEIDFVQMRWTVPAERMKRRGNEARQAHTVPLPQQAIDALERLAPLTNRGSDSFIFKSSSKAGYLAENTLRLALHRLGFEVTAHGFRSLLINELNKAGYRGDWVSRQLHHKDKDKVRAAYLRTDFYEQRQSMMCWWANACDAMAANEDLPELPAIPGLFLSQTQEAPTQGTAVTV